MQGQHWPLMELGIRVLNWPRNLKGFRQVIKPSYVLFVEMETLRNKYAAEQVSRIQTLKPVLLWCTAWVTRAAHFLLAPSPPCCWELSEPAMPSIEQHKHFCIDTPCGPGCGRSVKAISEEPGTIPSFRQRLQPPAGHTEPASRRGEGVGREGN